MKNDNKAISIYNVLTIDPIEQDDVQKNEKYFFKHSRKITMLLILISILIRYLVSIYGYSGND